MVSLPGDLSKDKFIEQVIRVNHAGEYGARRIYLGQMSILKSKEDQALLQHMLDQESIHLKYFEEELIKKRVRPSLLLPLWDVLGYVIGAGSAKLGKTSAMVVTEAIEEVIDGHYQAQIESSVLDEDLSKTIEVFRQEEVEHKNIAKKNMDDLSFGHKILYHAIKLGCKFSIEVAKKI